MSDDESGRIRPEIDDFLKTHVRTYLFSLRKDGSPTVHPMTGLYADGHLSFSSYRKSFKTLNVLRDGRISALVLNGYDTDELQAVVFQGPGRIREASEMPGRSRPSASPVSSGISGRANDRLKEGKRVLIDIEPTVAEFVERVREG